MKSEDLRKLQAPLKEKYRNDPSSAIITLRAGGNIGDGISCKVETAREMIEAGLHAASGGNGMLACSGDLLLEALVACAGVTLTAVATSLGIEVRSGTVKAEGLLDFRGTLGVSKEVPSGFSKISLRFDLDCDASAEMLNTLLRLTERYCVVYQTLKNGVPVETSLDSKSMGEEER